MGTIDSVLGLVRNALAQSAVVGFCPFEPNSDPQRQFVDSDDFELLMGGGTGGGKTFGMLMSFLRFVHVPGYKGLIYRRTYKALSAPDGPVWLSQEWFRGTEAQWSEGKQRWVFPTSGEPSVLQFAHCQYDTDVQNLMGPSWNFIGGDEIGEFGTPYVWNTLMTRLRGKSGQNIPFRMRATANPGGPGQQWIYDHFVLPGKYVHSVYSDNTDLDRDHYRKILDNMDEVSRKFYVHGDWTAKRQGLIYEIYSHHYAAVSPIGDDWTFIIGVDLGSSAIRKTNGFAVIGWHPEIPNQVYTFEAFSDAIVGPTGVAEKLGSLLERYPHARIKVDPGALGSGYIEEFQVRHGLPVSQVEKKPGYKLTARTYLVSDLEHGNIWVDNKLCADLIDECNQLAWDEKGLDAESSQVDHISDAWLYAYLEARAYWSEEVPKPKARDLEENEAALSRKLKEFGVEDDEDILSW